MKIKTFKIILIIIAVVSVTMWLFCASIQRYLDRTGIKEIAEEFEENFNPGNPETLRNYIDTFDFKKNTIPLETNNITISKFQNKKVASIVGKNITAELLSFPSHVTVPEKQDSARFFLFRKSKISNNKVILWIPGKGISNFAFRFIKKQFYIELEHGYNILLYIPPYHMSRKTEKSPETFFTSNVHHNLLLYTECIRELRTVYEYLKNQNVTDVSGWGGSMGASMLCNLTNIEKFEHICIMIPVLDWKTLTYNNKYTEKVIVKYKEAGFDQKLLKDAYNLISPINYSLNISQQNVQIQYAKYDQLTPEKVTIKFAEKNKIKNIKGYYKSHATILLSGKLFKDYSNFLDSISH